VKDGENTMVVDRTKPIIRGEADAVKKALVKRPAPLPTPPARKEDS
jgi:hypothetical protein